MKVWHEDSLQIHLDGLQLLERVGQGSVGEVWRARHCLSNSNVAVKFLMPGRLTDPWAIQALENELRTAACLHHPGIIQILDHEHLTHTQPTQTRMPHAKAVPYLVMEWISGGSLRPARGRLSWGELRPILLQLLQALAASHAKGVIHRDIKPSNILVRGSLDRIPHNVLLTDFGISHVLCGTSSVEGEVAGTLAYMAPEQLRGHLFEQGPWTDLFALGCTAWALATGRPPFGEITDRADLGHAQLALAPPAFLPVQPMPSGLEAWLRRLLRKDPQSRYRRAADAALALQSIVRMNPIKGPIVRSIRSTRHELNASTTRQLPALDSCPKGTAWNQDSVDSPARLPCLPVLRPSISSRPPRAPLNRWVPPPQMSPDLIRRRPLPLIGREKPREQLWSALREVHQSGKMRAVLVRGPGGIGCSCLASWLCEEAHRTGVGTPVLASDTPEPGGPAGLVSALGHHLRLDGLDRLEKEDRIRSQIGLLGHPIRSEINTLLALFQEPHSSLIQFDAAQGLALHRLYRSITLGPGTERPLVLHLDESQWALSSLQLVFQWLKQQSIQPLPLLVILVARSEALASRPEERELLTRMAALPEATDILLDPLDRSTQDQLFTEFLGLDDGLAQELGEHCFGNPAYALEVVTQWIEAGDLLRGPHGLTRRDPLAPIHVSRPEEIWLQRVDRLLGELNATDRCCVEIAAALGLHLSHSDWYRACSAAGFSPSPSLGRTLVHRAVWAEAPSTTGYRFVDPRLRASISHSARVAGRISGHHMACAQALQDRGIESLQRSRAIARHLLASSQPTAALPYLRVAAYSMLQQADLAGAAQQLRRHEAISEICAGEQPEEQLSADLLRAQSALLEGRIQRARTLLVWSIGSSKRQRLSRLEAQAQLQIGQIDLRAGRPMAAWRHARRSVALLEEQPDRTLSAEQQLLHGRICLMSGRPTRSLLHLAQAHAWYAELEDSDLGIRVFQPLASLALSKGQLSLAQSHLDRAMAAHGSRFDGPERVLETELLQVQLHRHSGDTETAHAHLCRLEAESNPALGDGRLYIQLERILVDLELGHSPDFGVIQDLLVRSKKIGLGHTLTTLRALQLVSRSIQGENKEISEAILELAQARAQTGLWSIEDRRLVQRMIDTQRTSHRVPLCLLPLLESCLENRPPHNRRSLLLELSPEPCSR